MIQLQTAFGGGKTHTMLAVYHLAKGNARPVSCRASIDSGRGYRHHRTAQGQYRRAGRQQARTQHAAAARQCQRQYTLGQSGLAVGPEAAYVKVKEADESGTSPGKDVLADYWPTMRPVSF